jgi:hypothetical protein
VTFFQKVELLIGSDINIIIKATTSGGYLLNFCAYLLSPFHNMKTSSTFNQNILISPLLFGGEFDVVCGPLDTAITKRKNDWLMFFDTYENGPFYFHEKTIAVLQQVFEFNDLIKEQTSIEFELSKAFYCQLFDLKRHLFIHTESAAHKLLMLSLIFGRYPGMFRITGTNYFGSCDANISDEIIDDFFTKALVRYETPHYFIRNFHFLNKEELEVFIHSLKGMNLRKHEVLRVQPTKNEFTQLMKLNAPCFNFHNYIFVRGLIYLRLIQVEDDVSIENQINDSALLTTFLKASHTFQYFPIKYLEDIAFWQRAFLLVLASSNDLLVVSITDCVDYLEYMKYQSNTDYNLTGRTPESLSRAIHNWHNQVYNEKHVGAENLTWEKNEELDLHFSAGNKEYACIQLNSGLELLGEGRIMKNCVITYAQSCANLNCSIWSLRVKRKNNLVPILTIEVINKTIVQARTKANSLPSPKHLDILHNWAMRIEYKIDLYKND